MSTHNPLNQHPLDIPEVLLEVALYLDAKDVLACSLVSRAFYSSFAPYIWRDCAMVDSISICDPPVNNEYDQAWERCQALVKRNSPRLRSLKLTNWDGKPRSGWGLITECLRYQNLRSLSLVCGSLNRKRIGTFWKICQSRVFGARVSLCASPALYAKKQQ